MKKLIKYFICLCILIGVAGCNKFKVSDEFKYYLDDINFEINENNMNLDVKVTNVSKSEYNIKYIVINFLDSEDNLIKKIKNEVNKNILSYESLDLELSLDIENIDYKGIGITLYDEDNILIKEISYKEEDINSSVKSITYDKSYLTIELNSDKKLEINNLKIEILDDNLEVKEYMIKNLNITLEPNVNKTIKININKELGKNLKFINLIET